MSDILPVREAVILSYRDKRTRDFASGKRIREFQAVEHQAERRLTSLEAATSLEMLRLIRGNRLEPLRGDRLGHWSIRINDQWRICFRWDAGDQGPRDVEIVDYH